MKEHTPDKWVVVKIINDVDVVYKVFGCWDGGYLASDSWQINSGITEVTEEKEHWLFKGYSGSIYKCKKGCYGVHSYGWTILSNYIAKAKDEGVDMIEMPEKTDWKDISYEL